MKKYTVELTKKQLQQLGIEVELKFIYPLFKRWKNTGEIVLFTSMKEGITVWKGNNGYKEAGHVSCTRVKHTSDEWEDIAYDPERDLWDKQPIECWDNMDTHRKEIKFYDAKNECSFSYAGERDGITYDNYKALSSNKYDEWIIEAYKTLEK